ncbi:MAG: TolC family outer membrane protein [Thiolinea sp.]
MNKLLLTSLTTLLLVTAGSQAHAENLLQAYQHAKNFDSQLKAQETSFLAILENKPQALSVKKPQISLSGNTALNQQIEVQDSSNATSLTGGYTLSLSKSLRDKNLDAQIEQVDASILQAKLQLEEQRQSLILRVAQPYFDYLTAIENLRFAETERKAVGQQLEQVKVFFEVGRSPITDLKEAESRFNLAVAQEVSAQQSVIVARENLRVLTGKGYQTLSGPRGNMPLTIPAPRDIDSWIKLAKENNKTLQTVKQAIEVARHKVEVQRANRSLKVNLFARQTGNFNINETKVDPVTLGASVGVEASMPIYQGGAFDSKIRQAQHEFRQAQQNYTYQERLVEAQVRSAYLAIKSSISEVKAQQQALTSAQTASEATKTGFEVGTRTAVDVMTTLRDVFRARSSYAGSRYRYLFNTLQLRQAAGTLSEKDLQALSNLLSQPMSPGSNGQTANHQQLAAKSRQQQAQEQRRRQHEARQRAQRQQNEARRRAHRQREEARLRAYRKKHGIAAPAQQQAIPAADIETPDLFNATKGQRKHSTSSDFVFIK